MVRRKFVDANRISKYLTNSNENKESNSKCLNKNATNTEKEKVSDRTKRTSEENISLKENDDEIGIKKPVETKKKTVDSKNNKLNSSPKKRVALSLQQKETKKFKSDPKNKIPVTVIPPTKKPFKLVTNKTEKKIVLEQLNSLSLRQTDCCWKCSTKFKTAEDAIEHIKFHTRTFKYVCEYCEKTFRTPSALKNHRNKHPTRNPYECKFCEKLFDSAYSKHLHEHVHFNDKLFLKILDFIDLTYKPKNENEDCLFCKEYLKQRQNTEKRSKISKNKNKAPAKSSTSNNNSGECQSGDESTNNNEIDKEEISNLNVPG